jgi:hypothetical protein
VRRNSYVYTYLVSFGRVDLKSSCLYHTAKYGLGLLGGPGKVGEAVLIIVTCTLRHMVMWDLWCNCLSHTAEYGLGLLGGPGKVGEVVHSVIWLCRVCAGLVE